MKINIIFGAFGSGPQKSPKLRRGEGLAGHFWN